ncbi:hypothetical protein PTSG_07450 [Salpingoeca rosetta]|uniref:2-(3-amino-3-carboxypropyl)histidine synthase subunit 2 n=1 Tax=Salpingoeca rosetta (strain ATCC 50818 / BSB-021) TaxID=946362 RepID=F2UIR7_SALR5|nr:uncharacterized protein PTSG_07450 [Salpingoeca rosetta]EGD77116.1 hypothetical protein PTSG_07450 [Salpingoeca rosetta]|eukprot:XP_004990955.1 hypothetical protein PTSG_07450 [Salpingoeca rosetta]
MSEEEPKSAFSNDGAEAMTRGVAVGDESAVTPEDMETFFELSRCTNAVANHPGNKIALQFPDELLHYGVTVTEELKSRTGKEFYLLADTTFGSCCVDEVAAEHVDADVVIHFGNSCLSRTSRLPALYVFGKYPLDQQALLEYVTKLAEEDASEVHVLFDVRYQHHQSAVEAAAERYSHVHVVGVDAAFTSAEPAPAIPHSHRSGDSNDGDDGEEQHKPRRPQQPPRFGRYDPSFTNEAASGHRFLFVGAPTSRLLMNHMLYFSQSTFFTFDPATGAGRQETARVNRQLMKRYFLIQKAKDAGTVGLVVGTLGSADYKGVTDRLRTMLRACGKKDYTLLVGKINPAKLANFDEIDIYCLVACPEHSLIDSAEFYRPVITPYELELACAPAREWGGFLESDFRQLVPMIDEDLNALLDGDGDDEREPHFSLISNAYIDHSDRKQELVRTDRGEIVARDDNTTLAQYGGGFLQTRTYQGLQQRLGETEVSKAIQGRTGVPIQYDEEPDTSTHDGGDKA